MLWKATVHQQGHKVPLMEDFYLCFYTCGLYSSRREAVWGEETNPDITRPRQVPQTRAGHPGQEPVTGARPHHLQGPRVPAAADNTVFSGKASRAFDIHTAPRRRQRTQQGASHQTPHPDFLMGGPTPELSGPSPALLRGLGQDTNLCLHFPSDSPPNFSKKKERKRSPNPNESTLFLEGIFAVLTRVGSRPARRPVGWSLC